MKKLLSILALLLPLAAAGIVHVNAASTYDVHNVPSMKLNLRATPATEEITINWPRRNGTQYAFPTTSGGVLEITQGTKIEQVYYSRAINNSSTKTFTLTGTVIRDLSWNTCTSYVSNGSALTFTPGADVRLVNDCRLYNLAAHVDRANTTSGSGSFICGSTSQPCIYPGSFTTAQRDAFTFGNDRPSIIYNSTSGTYEFRSGGSWLQFATSTGSFVNATESVAGKVELATIAEMVAATETGSTTAHLVLQAKNTARKSLGSADAGKLTLLDAGGTLSGSLLAKNSSVITRTNSGSYTLSAAQTYVQAVPTGSMMMWTTDTAPTGYLLAYGQAVSRTTYAELFAVIGTTFGVGDNSTTFNLPDMRGRYALGQDDMGGSSANRVTDTRADTIASGSGSETVTLTDAEVPSQQVRVNSDNGGSGNTSPKITDGTNSVTITTANTGAGSLYTTEGGGGAHNNMPPYITLNYIIKY